MKHHQESSVLVYISLCHVVYVLYSHASFYHTIYNYILYIIYYILYIIYYILYIIYTYWIDYNRFNVYLFFDWGRASWQLGHRCIRIAARLINALPSLPRARLNQSDSNCCRDLTGHCNMLQHVAACCNMLQHLNHIIYDIWLYDYICD